MKSTPVRCLHLTSNVVRFHQEREKEVDVSKNWENLKKGDEVSIVLNGKLVDAVVDAVDNITVSIKVPGSSGVLMNVNGDEIDLN